ncbi:hypothetical protein GCM10020256_51110 [Streptomyces thermocoprophilus]
MGHERGPDAVLGHGGQIGDLQIDGDRRGEEALLVAVVAHHHRRVDARVPGDGADGGALVAVGRETLAGRVEDRGAGGVGTTGGGAAAELEAGGVRLPRDLPPPCAAPVVAPVLAPERVPEVLSESVPDLLRGLLSFMSTTVGQHV